MTNKDIVDQLLKSKRLSLKFKRLLKKVLKKKKIRGKKYKKMLINLLLKLKRKSLLLKNNPWNQKNKIKHYNKRKKE